MNEFFAMGGYAWYVWMAYGAVAAALAVEVMALRARRRRALAQLRMSVGPPGARPSIVGARGHR